jgi:mRNA interferase MazF
MTPPGNPPSYPKRGEVYWTELDPTRGYEMQKTRPCLVITTNVVNQRRRTVVVIPLSTTSPKKFPLYVPLPSLGDTSQAVTDQIRVVDKERLKGLLGTVMAADMERVAEAMTIVFEMA